MKTFLRFCQYDNIMYRKSVKKKEAAMYSEWEVYGIISAIKEYGRDTNGTV